MDSFPNEICRIIYQYDPTYLHFLRDHVFIEMKFYLWYREIAYDRHFSIRNYMESWAIPPYCIIQGIVYKHGKPTNT